MLALVYLGLAICVGDRLCGRFFRYVSIAHRWATATLVGLLLSTGFTYLAARHFAGASNPLLIGDILFFVAAAIFLISCPPRGDPALVQPRVAGSQTLVWILLGLYAALATWMMFAVLDFKGGALLIGITQWSDYGPNTAIVQSFALGRNFPAEYPHFSGEPIRYHFLFYFLAGNLEFLGLNLVWSLNLISVLTLVCMLALVIAFGEVLFKSRTVGYTASALFFFHGTLNLVPFLRRQTSLKGALQAIYNQKEYLTSGYPYRGEDWGVWTQVVFINQRHLASAIGIFLVVLIFLFDRYPKSAKRRKLARVPVAGGAGPGPLPPAPEPYPATDLSAKYGMGEEAAKAELLEDGRRSDELQSGEQSFPTPETGVIGETYPAEKEASPEEPSPAADYSAAAEAPTFVSRAYEEYMRRGSSDTGTVSETPEPEAVEVIQESSPEPEIVAVTETPMPQNNQESPSASVPEPEPESVPVPVPAVSRGFAAQLVHDNLVSGRGFIFCGFLLGALPYWNAPVFTAAAAVLAFLFVLFPCRRYMLGLAVTAGVVALPQILALRSGNARSGASLISWGYTLGHVPVWQVVKYLGFTFGIKWVLILVALLFFSWRNLRLFIAIFSLFLVTFCFQFSDEVLANHKFLNIWLVVANLFVAYGLWRLWHLRIKGWAIPSRLVAVLLAFPIVLGGVIDFFPIHNGGFVYTNYTNDRLIRWVQAETKPDAVFMTDKFVNHPILLAGRRIFMGYTYFTWSSGYDLPKREIAYRQMFESKNAHQVFTLLKANGIDYVAFDSTVRGTFKNNNEQEVYAPNFKKVFDGADYYQLSIYKVPENADFVPGSSAGSLANVQTPAASLYEGGLGKENGQFNFPRGLAVDNGGNIFVADTNNDRLQKFSPAGVFLSVIGTAGSGPGQFRGPGGIDVDSGGNIYVADVANNRVQKLKADGSFLAEWKGPDSGFLAPRDVAVGADNSIYVADQGNSRIVRLDPNGKVRVVWGASGRDDGQFAGPNAVTVDGKNDRVYVADPSNKRIQVFDTNGKFIAKWSVEAWGGPTGWYLQDLALDSKAGLLYASSQSDEVLVFDVNGKLVRSIKAEAPDKVKGASSIALQKNALLIVNTFYAKVSRIDLPTK